jgi:4-hydroxy-tetrahydrodipicolinate synthase
MGKLRRCGLRLPLVPPTAATRSKLERLAGELGLLKHMPIPAKACARKSY